MVLLLCVKYLFGLTRWQQLDVIPFVLWYSTWQQYRVLLCIILHKGYDGCDFIEGECIVGA